MSTPPGGTEPLRHRAGRYIAQPTGYRAFSPAPLPPQPPVRLEGELQALLSKADRALGRLDGSIQTLPNPDLFVFMYVRKEAVLSSQIEGTQSSLQDLLAAEAHILSPDLPRDVDEVVNYVTAMNYGLARLAALPVSVRLIREIHERLLQSVRGARLTPGELRRTQNWIGPGGCTLSEATFVPPPPHEVPEALGALETFLHADSDIPALIQIGLAHAQFETIHPYVDGNGRTGRALAQSILRNKGLVGSAAVPISAGLLVNTNRYFAALGAFRDGDAGPIIRSFAAASRIAAASGTKLVDDLAAQLDESRAKLTGLRADATAWKVLPTLVGQPAVNSRYLQQVLGLGDMAALRALDALVDRGVLSESTGKARSRIWQHRGIFEVLDAYAESIRRMSTR